MDNYTAHKRVEIRTWLAANPRVRVHFTPTVAPCDAPYKRGSLPAAVSALVVAA